MRITKQKPKKIFEEDMQDMLKEAKPIAIKIK